MTDIHTHILPGLDDGAEDYYDSLEMAAMAYENGTTQIVATPHCNIPGVYGNYFGEEYIETFQKTCGVIEREGIPVRLMPGMEVFATIDLPQLLTEGKVMPLNQTRYVLMEFDFGEDPEFADEILRRVAQVGAWPVIAHVERYAFVQEEPQIISRWIARGYVVQVNKGSFLGRFGRRALQTAYRLLNHNLISVVASDAHSPVRRTTCMADAYESLAEEYPVSYLDTLFSVNPERICRGKKVVKFKNIPFRGEEAQIRSSRDEEA